jgi:flagellar hook-length control protein FliK
MQSLISQITNLFATQSLNSIENSELSTYSPAGTEFGGLLENFSNENDTANIAALGGNPLQATHTPISFQITQFALTIQPGTFEGGIEYNGQVINARVNGNLRDLTGGQILNTNSQNNESYDLTFVNNKANQTSIFGQDIDNNQRVPLPIFAGQIDNSFSADTELSTLATESAAKYDLLNQNQQLINIDSEDLVDNRSFLRNFIDTNSQEKIFQNNNALANDRPATNNISSNIFSESVIKDNPLVNNTTTTVKPLEQVLTADRPVTNTVSSNYSNETAIKDNALVNNITATVKPLEQALTAYSVISEGEKLTKNTISPNALPVENKISIANESIVTNTTATLSKGNLVDRPIIVDAKQDVQSAVSDVNKISNPVINNQVVTTEKVSPEDLPIDGSDVVAAKQTYNPLQQDELKHFNNSIRDEATNIRSNALDQNTFSDSINRGVSRNEVGIDLASAIKNQDIIQDVKFTPNNIAIDKANIQNPVATEQLSVSSRVSGFDRLSLQFNASNEVSNGDDLAQQIAWAKNNSTNNIKIAISPEHLGALEISIENDADGLNIQFVTQNATAKEALETFMPRLKEMLDQNGLNLQNANVSQQDKGQSDNFESRDSEQLTSQLVSEDQSIANNGSESGHSTQVNNRLLEAFA